MPAESAIDRGRLAAQPIKLTRRRLLLAEGRRDAELLRNLWKPRFEDQVQVMSYDSRTQLMESCEQLAATSGFDNVRSVLITGDNDDDPKQAMKGLEQAKKILQGNSRRRKDGPQKVILFGFPGHNQSGCLETLLLGTLGSDGPLSCVGDYFTCLQGKARGGRMRTGSVHDKCRFQVWAAGRNLANREVHNDPKAYGLSHEADAWKDFGKLLDDLLA